MWKKRKTLQTDEIVLNKTFQAGIPIISPTSNFDQF